METNNGKQGGLLKGDRHSAPSGGIKAVVVTDDNRPVLLEDNEVIINRKSVADPEVKTLTGTNKEILSQINQEHGGVAIMEKGGDITYEKAHGGAIESLQDVGEKIGGAKKDLVKQLSEVTSSDLEKQPLSKSFPEPDYTKMYKDGTITQEGAILIKFLYDHLPAKPRKSYRIAGWVATVQAAIDVVRQVIESESTKNIDFTTRIINIRSTIDSRFSRDYKIFSETMKGLGFPENNVKLGNFEIRVFHRTVSSDPSQATYAIIDGNTVVKDFTSMDDAIAGLKELLSKGKSKLTKFDVYQDRRTKEFFIGKKGAHDVIHIMDGFKSAKDAFTFVKDNRPELQGIWDGMKANIEERRSVNRERVGVDWRKGANISSEAFASKFGFRGVEFGNWVNPAERQSHVNEAYDALMDLSAITGIVPSGLSLNGEMGFAFGARGSGRANAHYEPGKVVINLTKTRGAGSLGHEWWHAVDNYFSRKRGIKGGFITESPKPLTTTTEIDATVERKEMIDAFAGIMEAISKTKLRNRALSLDRTRSEAYWSTSIEMSARCFENYIVNKLGETNYVNDYLANFKEVSEWINDTHGNLEIEKNFPYPLADEEAGINEAYKYFFETVQQRVDNGKTALFEKGGSLNKQNNNTHMSDLGNYEIHIGKMITDELSDRKYYITNIDATGFTLKEAHAIGSSEASTHVSYGEFEDKFAMGSISIDGYEHSQRDLTTLKLVLSDLKKGYDNYELGAKLSNIEKKKKQDEENRKKRDRFALGTQLEDEEKARDKRIREAYAKLDDKTANWIQENAPDKWKNSSLDDIPDEVFSVAQLRQKQVLMDEYDVVMDMGNGGDVTKSKNWVVTAFDKTQGHRVVVSQPLTNEDGEKWIDGVEERHKNALPEYVYLSYFKLEPVGHTPESYAKTGGRGFFGLKKGEKITSLDQIKVGDILLQYSRQFNADNTIKVIDERTIGHRSFDTVYWDPKENKRIGNEEMAISELDLKHYDFYKPETTENSAIAEKKYNIGDSVSIIDQPSSWANDYKVIGHQDYNEDYGWETTIKEKKTGNTVTMFENLLEEQKQPLHSFEIKKRINSFLYKFPKKATSWADATDELPELHHRMQELYNETAEKKYNGYDKIGKSKTPSIRNTKHREGIEKLLTMMNRDQIIKIYEDHKAWFVRYEQGGSIPNNYKGKTPEQVWDAWNEKQREQFLLDHSELLDNDREENNLGYSRIVQKNKKYSELTPHTINVLKAHIEKGQYAKGGEIDSKISAKYNIGWYGNTGMYIHSESGKVLKIFTDKKTGEENWHDAVAWGKKNEEKIKMADGGGIGTGDILLKDEGDFFVLIGLTQKGKKWINGSMYEDEKSVAPSEVDRITALANRANLKVEEFGKGGSVDPLEDSTYVSNRNIKEVTAIIKDELQTVSGSDLVSGVHVKNSALKGKPKPKVSKVNLKAVKNAILSKSASPDDKDEVTDARIQKLIDAGYNAQQIETIFLGYGMTHDIKSDTEFRGSVNGLLSYRKEVIDENIQRFVDASKTNSYEMGLKYPEFKWDKVLKKYGIPNTGKKIDGVASDWGNGDKRQYHYVVYIGKNVVLGKIEGKTVIKSDGKKEYQSYVDDYSHLNNGFLGVVSSKKEVLEDIAKMLLSQSDGYLKDLDMYVNTLGGIGFEPLQENNIPYEKGGEITNYFQHYYTLKKNKYPKDKLVDLVKRHYKEHKISDATLWDVLNSDSIFTGQEASDIYTSLGYKPFSGYPLERLGNRKN